jgi:SAM-dependent methyltransferase/tetratricopeptide (TPR) repeat protein
MLFDRAGDALHEQLFVEDVPARMSLYYSQMARYGFFSRFTVGKHVLDCGCGSGNQSYYLKHMGAASVTGIDISAKAIRYARRKYSDKDIRFLIGDVAREGLASGAFDVVVSSEVMEHLPTDSHLAYLSELRRVVRPDGVILLSTPNQAASTGGPFPFHTKEFTYPELEKLLLAVFTDFQIQRFRLLPVDGFLLQCESSQAQPVRYLNTAPRLADSCVPVPAEIYPAGSLFVIVISKIPIQCAHYFALTTPGERFRKDSFVELLSNRFKEEPGARLLPSSIAEILTPTEPDISRQILEQLLAELETYPKTALATMRFQTGCACLTGGDHAAAREYFRLVYSEPQLPAPLHFSSGVALAESCLATGDADQAASVLASLVPERDDEKQQFKLLIVRGRTAAAQGQTAKAEALFKEARALNSSRMESYLHLAALYRSSRRHSQSLEELELLLKPQMYPDAPVVYVEKALTHEAQGTLDAAEHSYRKALDLDPTHFEANLGLGMLLLSRAESQEAVSFLQRSVQLRPNRQEILSRCMMNAALGALRRKSVEHALSLAIQATPDASLPQWIAFFNELLQLREYAALVRFFAALAADKRCEPAVVSVLMPALHEMTDRVAPQALELADLVFEVGCSDPLLLYARASLLKRLGRREAAHQAFSALLACHSQEGPGTSVIGGAHFHLGELLLASGRSDDARREFQKCTSLLPGHAKAQERLSALQPADCLM